jgi:predicted metalloprotease with PDZ domain
MRDLEAALAAVSGDAAFARDFFQRYIEGREVVDYQSLLASAGIAVRKVAPGAPTVGGVRMVDSATGVRVGSATPFGSPLYEAGVDRDDLIVSFGGRQVTSAAAWNEILQGHKPGDTVPLTFRRRSGTVNATVTVAEDPRVQAVSFERIGQPLTAAQRAFRDAWLNSAGG